MVSARGVTGVLVALAGAAGLQCARADVYVWVDASGTMNVSNLSPPEDARVTSVIQSPPRTAAQEEAARDAARRAELQALNDRVARLQEELEQTRREAAWMPAAYPPPPMAFAPPPQYPSWAPPAVSYVADAAPPPAIGCDYPWNGCGIGWGGWPYGPTVVVVGGKGAHAHRGGPIHGARPVAPRPFGPIRPLGVSRRG